MSEHNTSRAIRYLPQVAVATAAVAVMPVVVVWILHDGGVISSPWLCMGLAIALSLAASVLGSAYWKRSHSAGDIFFSELLLWGWLHRLRGERRLAKTAGLLGLGDSDESPADSSFDLTSSDGQERTARLLREMAAALDAQDPYTDGHSRRVALHCAMVARKMALGHDETAKIRTAAAIHDIGKLRIPSELLNKPGELSDEEFEVVKRHPEEGAAIVACMDDPEITAMVRHHHERFDGAGYPAGLMGEATPLGARIIAVADTFDALTSIRPYRTAISHKRALQAIVEVAGTQLDPAVVRAFLRCYDANRAVLFWTLFAASPQRALAWLGGRAPGRANLASAATIAMPAALAAVVATAFSTASSVATAHPPLRLAQQTVSHAAHAEATPKHRARVSAAPAHAARARVVSKQAVLGVRQTRGAFARHSQRGSGASGNSGGGSGSGASSRGGKPPAPPRNGPGGTSTTTTATYTPPPAGSGPPLAVTAPTTTVSAPTAPTTSGTPVASGSGAAGGGTPTPAGAGTGADPGGGTGVGSPGGGSGGNQGGPGDPAGSQGGGSGSNQGGGSGGDPGGSGTSGSGSGSGSGGGPGHGEPTDKDECKDGGYAWYGFTNQGMCVAYVEHNLHH